jgi:hypothetical protein
MKYTGRILAGLYAAIVLLAGLYALATELLLKDQQVEHLLPSLAVAFVTLPLSLAGEPLYSLAPSLFGLPFVQLAFFMLCGAVQSSVLWWFVSPHAVRSDR